MKQPKTVEKYLKLKRQAEKLGLFLDVYKGRFYLKQQGKKAKRFKDLRGVAIKLKLLSWEAE